MPTTLREAVAYGSTDITSFVMQHCNKAAEKVSQDNFFKRGVFYHCLNDPPYLTPPIKILIETQGNVISL